MNSRSILAAVAGLTLLSMAWANQSAKMPPQDVKPFLGRWDLTLKSPDREYASWLEILQEDGVLKARMVGRWGNARFLPKVDIRDGELTFLSPKAEEGRPDDMVFRALLDGESLSGSTTGPDGAPWQWTGTRAPALHPSANPRWGKPVQLFNGQDTTGWTYDNPKATRPWSVENGTLVSLGRGANIETVSRFKDFKLHIEFNCGAKANSGVYLRGRNEVQIEDDSQREPPSHHTGGVYGYLAPSPEQPRKPGEWQSFDITLLGRMVTIVQNGRTVIDNKEIPGITGGALDSHEELLGPILLQGEEDGRIAFRNIVLTPAQ